MLGNLKLRDGNFPPKGHEKITGHIHKTGYMESATCMKILGVILKVLGTCS